MERMFRFTIIGEPALMFRPERNKYHLWDAYAQNKCNFRIDLLSQLKSFQLIEKPIDVIMNFYIHKRTKSKQSSLVSMYRFVNNIAAGILYKRETLIHNININKKFDEQPRTEIIIELKDVK